MSEICKNWSQWLGETRFAALTPEMREQTIRWLELVRDILIQFSDLKQTDTVLDIGTGTGLMAMKALELQEGKGKVIFSDKFQDCLDSCKEFLEQAGIKQGYEFLNAPCEDLKLDSNSIDKVFMRSVLVHIREKQPAINEIFRVLKPGGKYCAFEPIIRSNTKYYELLDPQYINNFEDFKKAETDMGNDLMDSLFNFDDETLRHNLVVAGFSVPDVQVQSVESKYVVNRDMVEKWFITPPSPDQPPTKERFLKYFDEAKINQYILDIQNYLDGREIQLKTNAAFIIATK
ncbi:class I SAM-dependent methyltransferase [bacterium]|nr:class I SAM-dependent methyltransferase [bacterium]